jgi:hypothetical protein
MPPNRGNVVQSHHTAIYSAAPSKIGRFRHGLLTAGAAGAAPAGGCATTPGGLPPAAPPRPAPGTSGGPPATLTYCFPSSINVIGGPIWESPVYRSKTCSPVSARYAHARPVQSPEALQVGVGAALPEPQVLPLYPSLEASPRHGRLPLHHVRRRGHRCQAPCPYSSHHARSDQCRLVSAQNRDSPHSYKRRL